MNCPLILRRESLVAILFCCAAAGLAQDPAAVPDPFGTDSKPTPSARPATKPKVEVQDTETNPTVLAIRNSNPQTAVELLRATENLVNLSRPEDAKRYLRRLSASNFEPATLWSLQRQFGSALFLRLAREESIQPEGRAFADAVLKASVQMSRDPARLDSLIRQLSDPSAVVRHGAMVELRGGGEAAAVALIQVLANPERSAEHPVVIEALTLLGGDAEGPLLATRDAPDEGLRQRALVAIGQLQTQTTVPYLLTAALGSGGTASPGAAAAALTQRLGGIPTRSAAERYLHQQARSYFDGLAALPIDHEGQVRVWRWDETEQRPVEVRVPAHQGQLLIAGRIARELVALVPDSAEYRRLYVGAMLEQAKLAGGWDQPLDRADGTPFHLAAQLPAPELETLLQFMLDKSHPAGAMASCEVLGAVATPAHLIQANGQPSVLCRALQNKERRVRFAALQAILEIDPRERYPGASFVPEALGFFANHSGSRRALVAHPRTELAQTLSGILQGLGLAADIASTGHEALQKAAQAADWEFVLISDAIDRPAVGEMLQLLRREPRTARLPVAILASSENTDALQEVTRDDPLAMTFHAPYDPNGMTFLIGRLRDRVGVSYVPADERLRQAGAALEALVKLASRPEWYGFYDLVAQQAAVERATATPELCQPALQVLGLLATPAAQRSLVALASQTGRPIAERRAAAQAFEASVERRGVLLTRDEILSQYDRYNASATQNEDTQQVLGALLDTIEASAAGEEPSPIR